MMRRHRSYCLAVVITISQLNCRKPFNPPSIQVTNHFLVIDGFVNTGVDAISTFTLTRSLNLNDSTINFPAEQFAQVSIRSSSGNTYQLLDTFNTGVYASAPLDLDISQTYQVDIITSDGNHYESDTVTSKTSPPIDSVSWALVNDPVSGIQIQIYVNAHDPNESTHYYRWDYIETYEHLAFYQAAWGLRNGLVYPYPSYDSGTYFCYSTVPSNSILLGSSIAQNRDVISRALINTIPENDRRLDVEYSILVRQYPLTANSYNYWLTIQKNSQSLGGLFDLQPSQITGNYHGITHTVDPVLGYLTAGSVFEKRIFISHASVPDWKSQIFLSCSVKVTPTDPQNFEIYNFRDTSYGPYYFSGAGLVVAPKVCIDCRYQGGTLVKPSYWP